MVKIVILGSCRFEPYEILASPEKNDKWNTEDGYKMATERFYPAIEQADEVWVYVPDGMGEHTRRDMGYAIKQSKVIRILGGGFPSTLFPQPQAPTEAGKKGGEELTRLVEGPFCEKAPAEKGVTGEK